MRETPLGGRLVGPTQERLGWRAPLDGMRGAAVICVMLVHFLQGYWFHGGVISVELFFVLSGFLITTLLFEEHANTGRIDLPSFYRRRAHRLLPALGVLLIAVSAVCIPLLIVGLASDNAALRSDAGGVLGEVLATTFNVYNVLVVATGVSGKVLLHLWTLSNENQFYFVWPAVLVAVLRRPIQRTRIMVTVLVTLILAFAAARVALEPIVGPTAEEGGAWKYVYRLAVLRPESILIGCLLAIAWRAMPRNLSPLWKRVLRIGAVVEVALLTTILVFGFSASATEAHPGITITPPFGHVPGINPFGGILYQVAVIGLPLLLLDTLHRPEGVLARAFAHRWLVAAGKRSYSVYLWHNLVNFAVTAMVAGAISGGRRVALIALIPNLVLSFVIGGAAYRWVELRGLRRSTRTPQTVGSR